MASMFPRSTPVFTPKLDEKNRVNQSAGNKNKNGNTGWIVLIVIAAIVLFVITFFSSALF
ncbi:MAG TPA: hypothetical protein VFM60_00950 [Salinimicrobium sp.]|nr:hypothetical protein [Salinimicrobium sp.]